MSLSNNLIQLIRLFAFLMYAYSIYYRNVNETLPVNQRKKPFGKWKYLTYWDLLLQFLFISLTLISSIKWSPKSLGRLVDFIFYSLAFPVAMFVSISFWLLWSIDRELVFPKAYDPYYPYWLHQTSHTLVAVVVCFELVLGKWNPPKKQAHGLIAINLFSYVYAFWVLYIAIAHNVWVYPVLVRLNWPLRVAFGLILGLINSIFYFFAIWFHKNFKTNPTKAIKMK